MVSESAIWCLTLSLDFEGPTPSSSSTAYWPTMSGGLGNLWVTERRHCEPPIWRRSQFCLCVPRCCGRRGGFCIGRLGRRRSLIGWRSELFVVVETILPCFGWNYLFVWLILVFVKKFISSLVVWLCWVKLNEWSHCYCRELGNFIDQQYLCAISMEMGTKHYF